MSEPVHPPRLRTRRALIRDVAARWCTQYQHDGRWGQCIGGSAHVVYDKLMALDLTTANRGAIDAVIGNDSWTELQCHGCRRDVEVAVEVGQLPDYASATVTLCADCIALAANLLATAGGGARPPTGTP